jgi:hypothetical protein
MFSSQYGRDAVEGVEVRVQVLCRVLKRAEGFGKNTVAMHCILACLDFVFFPNKQECKLAIQESDLLKKREKAKKRYKQLCTKRHTAMTFMTSLFGKKKRSRALSLLLSLSLPRSLPSLFAAIHLHL